MARVHCNSIQIEKLPIKKKTITSIVHDDHSPSEKIKQNWKWKLHKKKKRKKK
jgi:hypothetical protein